MKGHPHNKHLLPYPKPSYIVTTGSEYLQGKEYPSCANIQIRRRLFQALEEECKMRTRVLTRSSLPSHS